MNPVDVIVIAVIGAILGFAGWFVYRSRKNGKKCIGCPDSGMCSAAHCCNCGKTD